MITHHSIDYGRRDIYNNTSSQELTVEFAGDLDELAEHIITFISSNSNFSDNIKNLRSNNVLNIYELHKKDYNVHNIINFDRMKFEGYIAKNLVDLWKAKYTKDNEKQKIYNKFVDKVLIKLSDYILPRCKIEYSDKIVVTGDYFSFSLDGETGAFFLNE